MDRKMGGSSVHYYQVVVHVTICSLVNKVYETWKNTPGWKKKGCIVYSKFPTWAAPLSLKSEDSDFSSGGILWKSWFWHKRHMIWEHLISCHFFFGQEKVQIANLYLWFLKNNFFIMRPRFSTTYVSVCHITCLLMTLLLFQIFVSRPNGEKFSSVLCPKSPEILR